VIATSAAPCPAGMPGGARLECIPLLFPGDARLFLRRAIGPRAGKPVLLIHGASAAGDTFLVPAGASVVDFLVEKGFDVWILDWRTSFHVTAAEPALANQSADHAAAVDLPAALEAIRTTRHAEKTAYRPTSVIAHCMGAACLSMGIGAGLVTRAGHEVDRVLLSSIGLFYEVSWDGWAKVQDRVLERVFAQNPGLQTVSPLVSKAAPWPAALEEVFALWPAAWGPPWEEDFFQRLAFLFGQPFLVSNLHPDVTREVIRGQFGAIPFSFYRHTAQQVLRGFAGKLDAEAALPIATPNGEISTVLSQTYLNPARFAPFDLTLLTGAGNPLWHRDSVDRMGEWLRRQPTQSVTKHVLDGYGHQDLWWGRHSARDVFPLVFRAVC